MLIQLRSCVLVVEDGGGEHTKRQWYDDSTCTVCTCMYLIGQCNELPDDIALRWCRSNFFARTTYCFYFLSRRDPQHWSHPTSSPTERSIWNKWSIVIFFPPVLVLAAKMHPRPQIDWFYLKLINNTPFYFRSCHEWLIILLQHKTTKTWFCFIDEVYAD